MKTILALSLVALTAQFSPAADKDTLQPGLLGQYFKSSSSLSDFVSPAAGQKPEVERVDPQINFPATLDALPGTKLEDNFCVVWTGVIRIPKDGQFTFILESDDGSRLFVDGKPVVDNSGLHEMTGSFGKVELKAGDHDIKVEFFEAEEEAGCVLYWKGDGIPKEILPASVLFHRPASNRLAELSPGRASNEGDKKVRN